MGVPDDLKTLLSAVPSPPDEPLPGGISFSDNGWLPVASDGSGNFYILDLAERASGKTPVSCIDVHEDPDSPAYVVASGFWLFLEFLLRKELGDTGWFFSKSDVLARDPDYEGQIPGWPG